MKQIDSRCDDA